MNNLFCIENGDCIDVLRQLPENSVDAVVTDPPAGIAFMGKAWDRMKRDGMTELQAFQEFIREVFVEVYRVLKPGGHAVVWALPRTSHHTAMGLERAGFDIRDNGTYLFHVFGSGFPKSLDVSKAIDKAAGAEREVVGFDARKATQQTRAVDTSAYGDYAGNPGAITAPATDAARQWQGWGTALKPAVEFWILARKPLDGTVAENVLAHGTGALNIDGCRIETDDDLSTHANGKGNTGDHGIYGHYAKVTPGKTAGQALGRWPSHLLLDEGAAALLDGQSEAKGASRFFYVAKASKRDKDEGLDDLPERSAGEKTDREEGSAGITPFAGSRGPSKNSHPTVKPIDLMRYLCRLVTPPGGVVLDPFMGSGSTGKAALLEGFRFIGIEKEAEYFNIAERRLNHAAQAR